MTDIITSISPWGNSLGLRIPAAMAKKIGLTKNAAVKVSVLSGSLRITPQKTAPSIDDLIAAITPENSHGEMISGSVGKELL